MRRIGSTGLPLPYHSMHRTGMAFPVFSYMYKVTGSFEGIATYCRLSAHQPLGEVVPHASIIDLRIDVNPDGIQCACGVVLIAGNKASLSPLDSSGIHVFASSSHFPLQGDVYLA